jgi:hypothetical protein
MQNNIMNKPINSRRKKGGILTGWLMVPIWAVYTIG